MGSKKRSVEFLPYVDASYTYNWIKPFLSVADGAGLKVFENRTGIFSSLGLDFGESRKRSDNAKLEGTGALNNPVRYFAKAGIETEPFDLLMCVSYFPVISKYAQRERNRKYNGILYSSRLITGYPLRDNLIFQAEFGMSFMNDEFAEAYHSVKYKTGCFSAYDADAGVHDAYCETTIVWMLTDSVSLISQGRYERLLGDAGRSPLTETKNTVCGKLFMAYSF
jgi:outer membrane scaffolding protein for murein synthesis (MipA/OmpV family)